MQGKLASNLNQIGDYMSKQEIRMMLEANATGAIMSADDSIRFYSIHRKLEELAAKVDACLITLDEAKMAARKV